MLIGTADSLQIKIRTSNGVQKKGVIILQKFLMHAFFKVWSVSVVIHFVYNVAMKIIFPYHATK
jgi:hypothetical protein